MQTTTPYDSEQFEYVDGQSENTSESQDDSGDSPVTILDEENKAQRSRKRKRESDLENSRLEIESLKLLEKQMDLLNSLLGPIANDADRIWMADYCRKQVRLILDPASVLPGPEVKDVDTSQLTINVVDEAIKGRVDYSDSILKKYDRAAAKAYRKKHGEDPLKHEKIVNGRRREVYHFSNKDRDLVLQAIQRVIYRDLTCSGM